MLEKRSLVPPPLPPSPPFRPPHFPPHECFSAGKCEGMENQTTPSSRATVLLLTPFSLQISHPLCLHPALLQAVTPHPSAVPPQPMAQRLCPHVPSMCCCQEWLSTPTEAVLKETQTRRRASNKHSGTLARRCLESPCDSSGSLWHSALSHLPFQEAATLEAHTGSPFPDSSQGRPAFHLHPLCAHTHSTHSTPPHPEPLRVGSSGVSPSPHCGKAEL